MLRCVPLTGLELEEHQERIRIAKEQEELEHKRDLDSDSDDDDELMGVPVGGKSSRRLRLVAEYRMYPYVEKKRVLPLSLCFTYILDVHLHSLTARLEPM